jgi:hypothetical protein
MPREDPLTSQDLALLPPEGHVTNWYMPRGDAEHIVFTWVTSWSKPKTWLKRNEKRHHLFQSISDQAVPLHALPKIKIKRIPILLTIPHSR